MHGRELPDVKHKLKSTAQKMLVFAQPASRALHVPLCRKHALYRIFLCNALCDLKNGIRTGHFRTVTQYSSTSLENAGVRGIIRKESSMNTNSKEISVTGC